MPHLRLEVGIITTERAFEAGVFSCGPIHPNDAIHMVCEDASYPVNDLREETANGSSCGAEIKFQSSNAAV